MKQTVILFTVLFIVFTGCSDEKSDEFLLQKDREALKESLDSYKIMPYKFGKLCIRSAVSTDTTSEDIKAFKEKFGHLGRRLAYYEKYESLDDMSVMDYVRLYKDYSDMNDMIENTDEDIFPPLTTAFSIIYGDSLSKPKRFEGQSKLVVQNAEHAILSTLAVLSKSLGKEVALYECYKTNPELLPDSEIKSLMLYYRGVLFFSKRLFYLSEHQFTQNINWLANNKDTDLSLTRGVLQWPNLSNEQAHNAYLGLNYLIRGVVRMQMEREIDEQRSVEDFGRFLTQAEKAGLDNELVWAVGAFYNVKVENKQQAISYLKKLKRSELLTDKELETIDESIAYLKERDGESLFTGVKDKFFIGKIVSRYVYKQLKEVPWKKVLKEHDVPYTDEMFASIKQVQELSDKINANVSSFNLENAGDKIKEESEGLLEKANELLE